MPDVASSQDIETVEHALAYYAEHPAGVRRITCHGKRVAVVFERDATHIFSEAADSRMSPEERKAWQDAIPPDQRVERRLANGRIEVRRFSLERARLLDHVLPAVSNVTVTVPGTPHRGQENRMLHGPALADGRHMRVILQPPRHGRDVFTCISAYPVSMDVWRTTPPRNEPSSRPEIGQPRRPFDRRGHATYPVPRSNRAALRVPCRDRRAAGLQTT